MIKCKKYLKIGENNAYTCQVGLACSLEVHLKSTPEFYYIYEILNKYDTDLKSFMIDITDNGDIIDKIKYKDESLEYILNLEDYYFGLSKVLEKLHIFGLAHGDIKPGNIFLKLDRNDPKKVISADIGDFDSVCVSTCEARWEWTTMYATDKFKKQEQKPEGSTYDIKIKQESDFYAFYIILLQLWFGFKNFSDYFSKDNVRGA